MLSILIPIYNCDVTKLVDELHKQCGTAKILFEILCFDDGSSNKYRQANASLASYIGVNYTEMSKNLGRAKIRNWLAKSASYDNLLFLDCDSKLTNKTFIKRYLKVMDKAPVISGGRIYSKRKPTAQSKILHWKYGKFRESKSEAYRNKHPYLFFHTNNFLIKKQLILDIKFDESIYGYGYEDLLFAQLLKEKGLTIRHIENPVQHLGLEKTEIFLSKTRKSLDNLLLLNYKGQVLPTRLVQLADRIIALGFHEDFMKLFERFESYILKNLHGPKPSMRYMDAFKLNYYLKQRHKLIYDRKL
ncbi:MAG: glycosyltransferase [Saprospiraceae bacterium]|nr:glycosyltransferase [Saprospiraceae bacterium]